MSASARLFHRRGRVRNHSLSSCYVYLPTNDLLSLRSARTTPIPTLAELTALYSTLPTIPPPLPRQRRPPPLTAIKTPAMPAAVEKAPTEPSESAAPPTATTTKPIPPTAGTIVPSRKTSQEQAQPPAASVFRRLFSFLPFVSVATPTSLPQSLAPPPRRVNPFMALRQGNKTVVIAAVDAGVISFYRFGEGNFKEWPMV